MINIENLGNNIEQAHEEKQTQETEMLPQKIEQGGISPEARKYAEQAILKTLDLNPDIGLENFQEKLRHSIESIPKYQELEQKLADVPAEELPYEFFKAIQRSSDIPLTSDQEKDLPKDGVLIDSIKQGGPLMCAGRVMIASTFLQKHGIEHNVISTIEGDENKSFGHAAMLLNIDKDTLCYFDAQNNLYFTFPKSALRGYEGTDKTSECFLEEYMPSESDIIDGLNSVSTRSVALPPSEGIANQYLNNISAALGGNKEFIDSNIKPNEEAKEAVDQIRKELIEENTVMEKFREQMGITTKEFSEQDAKKRAVIIQLDIENKDNKEGFIQSLSSKFQTEDSLINSYPYLKNASEEIRQRAAEQMWGYL